MLAAAIAQTSNQLLLMNDPRIIVALDFNSAADALCLANKLDPRLCRLKVGKELFTATGPQLVEKLMLKAVEFAGNKPTHVFILSIPDWGITPFAADRDIQKIASEIDAYNLVCKTMAEKYRANFIDITASQRADSGKEGFLVADKLHPGEKEYAKWAEMLCEKIIEQLG